MKIIESYFFFYLCGGEGGRARGEGGVNKVIPDILTLLSPLQKRVEFLKKPFMVYNIYPKKIILVMMSGVEQRKTSKHSSKIR